MTLAKTCHANNMMQGFKKQLTGVLQPRKLSESRCFNISLLYLEKIESHLESLSSDAQRINLTFVPYSFVANFVSYIFLRNIISIGFHFTLLS